MLILAFFFFFPFFNLFLLMVFPEKLHQSLALRGVLPPEC